MMSKVRGKNTKPEMLVRRELHKRGFRYKIHDKNLPGKPDLVLPKYHSVIFVNGCFWHGHHCLRFQWPKSNQHFWRKKIEGNMARDEMNCSKLSHMGWRVLTIWECSLKMTQSSDFNMPMSNVTEWLINENTSSPTN